MLDLNFNNVLMVCVGNICRSPMAEALLHHKLSHHHIDIKINSAGLGALVNYPADKISQALMLERNIDISNHKGKQITNELITQSDLILVMEKNHINNIHHILPLAKGRVYLLGKWGNFEILDPYKQSRHQFEMALELIEQGVDEWIKKIWLKY